MWLINMQRATCSDVTGCHVIASECHVTIESTLDLAKEKASTRLQFNVQRLSLYLKALKG